LLWDSLAEVQTGSVASDLLDTADNLAKLQFEKDAAHFKECVQADILCTVILHVAIETERK
jgi:hypothetical protein